MLKKDEPSSYKTLQEHLKTDEFFKHLESGETYNTILYIIDDHHFNNSEDPKTREFYVKAFAESGVREITIFLQARNYRLEIMDQVRDYCRSAKIPENEYIAFQTLVDIPLTKRIINEETGRYETKASAGRWGLDYLKKMVKNSLIAIDFINQMWMQNGIDVKYQYYDNLHFRPPFHGRYWITPEGKGYIVDGSLNTIEKDLVFVQKMDDENYDRVKYLFDTHIAPDPDNWDRRQYPAMDDKTIEIMCRIMAEKYNFDLQYWTNTYLRILKIN